MEITAKTIFKSQLFYYYLFLYIIQWIIPESNIAISYLFTILIFIPPILGKNYLIPVVYVIFNMRYCGNTLCVLNLVIVILIMSSVWFKTLLKHPEKLLLLLLLYIFLIDTVNGHNLSGINSVTTWTRQFLLIAFLLPHIKDKKSLDLLANGMVFCCIVTCLIVLLDQTIHGQSQIITEENAIGDRNYISAYLNVGLTILLSSYFNHYKNPIITSKLLQLLLSLLILVVIIINASRAGLVTSIVVMVVALFSQSNVSLRRKFSIILSGISIFVAFFYLMIITGISDQIIYRFFEEGTLENASGRTDIMEDFFIGYNNESISHRIFGGGGEFSTKLINGVFVTHNDFLSALGDYGIIGLLLFVTLIFKQLIGILKNNIFSTILMIVFVIEGLSCTFFSTPAVIPLFLIALKSSKLSIYAHPSTSLTQPIL